MEKYNEKDIASYFFSLDPERKIFNQNLISRNNVNFYEGNARLNKYMHLAQNIYLAMTGKLLIDTSFYAYANGAVIPAIQRDYKILSVAASKENDTELPLEIQTFLKKFFKAFESADIDEIIEIDHEDEAWIEKSYVTNSYEKQKMDTMKHKDEYKKQYADMIKVLERMEV